MLKLGNHSIFESVRLVSDINVKLSCSTAYDANRQILVIVDTDNVLLFRLDEDEHCEESKTKALTFFQDQKKDIKDIYFHPSGSWLLVVTFDNTIHVVPVYNLFKDEDSALTNQVFNTHTVTSFIVPFIGPHDCSNSRTCPNQVADESQEKEAKVDLEEELETDQIQEASKQPCPFPTSVCWWHCLDGRNRAVIGYNDGCICFVDLSPNAPYITNLRMDEAVTKLDIFRDLRSELFYLLISCTTKQYKLLLENKSLNYTFPSKPPDSSDIVSSPERLTKDEAQYRVQNLRNTFLLSAIHNDTESLSVHSIDKNCTPVFVYRLLNKIENVLISSNLLYVIQRLSNSDILQIISSHFSSVMEGDEDSSKQALLGDFDLGDERVLSFYQMTTSLEKPIEPTSNDNTENQEVLSFKDVKNISEYYNFYNSSCGNAKSNVCQDFHAKFPKLSYEPCYLVTDRSLYIIKFRKRPSEIFYEAALSSDWSFCETFSKVFDLPYQKCIESYGDLLLREKKVSQALLTYNVIKLPPLAAASKLAECGETYALMHLCAMALKITYILKSRFYSKNTINHLVSDGEFRHSENFSKTFESTNAKDDMSPEGSLCSDFVYTSTSTRLQMSPPSQFHLSNLLLLTLAEKSVNDKILLPLWTFITTNSKFHTNMASNVLSQSGLYSSALLLGLTRGDAIDCLSAMVKVIGHHFDWYSEINTCLYNLSEEFLMEALIYSPVVSAEYFFEIQSKIEDIKTCVLKRLEIQLNPFSPKFRPVISLSPGVENNEIDIGRSLVETYLAVVMQLYLRANPESINNALRTFELSYEEHQIPEVKFKKSFSAGCSNGFCVIDNVAYGWGSNGINYLYSTTESNDAPLIRKMEFFTDLNIKVYATKCGRQHVLFLTNNGLYSIGSNRLGQLGIGDIAENALQPMLLTSFDNKHITHFECGQYHNAAVANGQLYTWGWGVFGQLGNGTIENSFLPEVVNFFDDKKISQLALGHNHTMVLCVDKNELTSLYVFGSNHFGQLGINDPFGEHMVNKSLVPVKLYLPSNADLNITMINTKFFSNLVVDKKNNLYTWGTSPHALRMITQAKRRTNVKQKLEESLRKEIARRSEDEGENKEVPPPEFEKDFEMVDMKKEEAPQEQPKPESVNIALQEPNYYMLPRIVDTIYVTGDIKEISSGLYHFALISTSGTLYTWGKNLEYQLGNGDGERKSISFPQIVEGITNPIHVECGADFTLVMMDDLTMKSFGGNANGQCAVPLTNTQETKSGRLFCLPTTKRLLRLEGKCVITPTEVNLPRPRINLDNEPIRHLKSLPKFKSKFVKILDLELENGQPQAFDSETSLYIHYCLFLFHGLYDTNKILNFCKNRVEFHVRLLLLNFEHVTAFKICLTTCKSSKDALKLFEFFTKDTLSTLPMKKHHIKYCIYYLLQHFLDKKFEFSDCEQYFMNDLDYYLLELSFVLYLSNNNNFEFEQFFDEKFNNTNNILMDDANIQQDIFQLNYIDMIFENLTVKFKTVVCQKLMQKICQKD